MAPWHLPGTSPLPTQLRIRICPESLSPQVGTRAAELAVVTKCAKCVTLPSTHLFVCRLLRLISYRALGQRLQQTGGDAREVIFFSNVFRLPSRFQRYNAIAFRGSFSGSTDSRRCSHLFQFQRISDSIIAVHVCGTARA